VCVCRTGEQNFWWNRYLQGASDIFDRRGFRNWDWRFPTKNLLLVKGNADSTASARDILFHSSARHEQCRQHSHGNEVRECGISLGRRQRRLHSRVGFLNRRLRKGTKINGCYLRAKFNLYLYLIINRENFCTLFCFYLKIYVCRLLF